MRVANLIIVAMVVALLAPAAASADLLQSPIDGTGIEIAAFFGEGGGGNNLVDNISFSGPAAELSIWGYSLTDNTGGEIEYRMFKDMGGGNYQMFFGGFALTGNGTLGVTPTALLGPNGETVNKYTMTLGDYDISDLAYINLEGIDYNGDNMGILTSSDGDGLHYQGSENLSLWGWGQIGDGVSGDFALEIISVPEPSTFALLLAAFAGLALLRKRK